MYYLSKKNLYKKLILLIRPYLLLSKYKLLIKKICNSYNIIAI